VTEQLRNPRKIYAVDNGLIRSIRFSGSEDHGRYLENLVFLELRRRTKEIYYHSGKAECDFLIAENGRPAQAIQVCWDCSDPRTREREARGLQEAMEKYGVKKCLILTRNESGEIIVDGKKVPLLPFWWWALRTREGKR
jgi:predicted AAA+ superfamily ATPase